MSETPSDMLIQTGTSRSQGSDQENDPKEEKAINCICGDNGPNSLNTYICCDGCHILQHNICMGVAEDDDSLPDRYWCQKCRPEEHQDALQAMERGERIWMARYQLSPGERRRQWEGRRSMIQTKRRRKGLNLSEENPGGTPEPVSAEDVRETLDLSFQNEIPEELVIIPDANTAPPPPGPEYFYETTETAAGEAPGEITHEEATEKPEFISHAETTEQWAIINRDAVSTPGELEIPGKPYGSIGSVGVEGTESMFRDEYEAAKKGREVEDDFVEVSNTGMEIHEEIDNVAGQ